MTKGHIYIKKIIRQALCDKCEECCIDMPPEDETNAEICTRIDDHING